MKPRSTEKPVASTPNTPEARSPSLKKLPSGARRRTSSITVVVRAVAISTGEHAQHDVHRPLLSSSDH